MKKEIPTSHNLMVDFISLDKFIDLIKIVETEEDRLVPFNSLINHNIFGDPVQVEGEVTAYYQRCVAPLVSDKEGLGDSLINQAKIHDKFNDSFQMLVEDMVIDSVMEYGSPDYMVNIGHRKWMATNTNDFVVYENKKLGKKALACTAKGRLVIHNILKITKEEAELVAKRLYGEIK